MFLAQIHVWLSRKQQFTNEDLEEHFGMAADICSKMTKYPNLSVLRGDFVDAVLPMVGGILSQLEELKKSIVKLPMVLKWDKESAPFTALALARKFAIEDDEKALVQPLRGMQTILSNPTKLVS